MHLATSLHIGIAVCFLHSIIMHFHLPAFVCAALIYVTNAYSTGHSFDVAKDYKVCEKSAVYLKHADSVDDYGKFISRELKDLSREGGGTVYLKSGDFKIKSPIILANRTCLAGDTMDDTTIRAHKNYALPAVVSNFSYRISLRNLQILMPRDGPAVGIAIKASSIIWIKGVRVRNGKQAGCKCTCARACIIALFS